MKTGNFFKNFQRSLADNRRGIAAVVTAVAATTVLVTAQSGSAIVPSPCCSIPISNPIPPINLSGDGKVHLATTLAQSKVIQGADGRVSIEVNIDTPAVNGVVNRKPTDFIVVLDRSGSMSADNRLPFAKSAIRELLSRLQEGDRMGLITFDSAVETPLPLSYVNEQFKSNARRVIDSIAVGGSTNIGDALREAQRQVPALEPGRIRKVMLLSDGEANVGTVDPSSLGQIAHSLTDHNAVLSTIGMGLGFNEQTMSLLADRGMGNYSYLENLEKLGAILARDVDATRAILAQASRLDLIIPDGARVIDGGGYPFIGLDSVKNGFRFETGQLVGGARKSFFITVQLPTGSTGEMSFASAKLNYDVDGVSNTVTAEGATMTAAVVPQERAAEAAASIKEDVYRRTWAENNLGLMKSKVGQLLREGKREDADKAIADFRGQVAAAERQSKIQLLDAPASQAIDTLQADAKDAFAGSDSEQTLKQNRYGKKYHAEGRSSQRKN